MDNFQLTKKIASFVIRPGINHIVNGIVETNVPQTNLAQKALVLYGKIVIASIVGDYASKHVETKIDEAAAWLVENVNTDKK